MGTIGISMLRKTGFEIPLVFTHLDDPDETIWFKSVSELCTNEGIEWVVPPDPNRQEWINQIRSLEPDIIFSFYYRFMLSTQILEIPRLGAYNLHGSYLPYYRGRCPVNWVIISGENSTGVTLHEMVEKSDAGPIVAQRPVEIALDDTPRSLFSKLEHAAELLLKDILPRIRVGDIRKIPQDLEKGSYFGGRKPEDGRIAWEQSARDIYNLIRGVTRPYPGAFSFLGSTKILFWWAEFDESCQCDEGKIETTDDAVIIGTGRGCIFPREIEVNGRIFTEQPLVVYFKEHNGEFLQ